ncbi:MAG: lactate racemase domain-containing protein [Chloroflexi bacterium]|nr:lactate racemase domain-containing protein [Chloroflexota bacterium]
MSSPEPYPMMYPVEQQLVSRPIADIPSQVRAELERWSGWSSLPKRASIAITAGSRGIANIALILRVLCDDLKRRGFQPFLVPAMGAHGGASVEGQLALLADLAITPKTIGAPIRASLEVDEIGHSCRGQPVMMDHLAHRADGLIVVGRVKKHTDFTGPVESGLAKMIAIGLGKHDQAAYIHSFGAEGLRTLIPEYARIALENSSIIFGLAIIEDGYDATSDIILIPRERIADEEPSLLRRAVEQMAKLPIKNIDLLIIERMGKEISGSGMDTNVIGRFRVPGEPDPPAPRVEYLVVLDLTDASHGNAIGMGLADLTTARLASKIDQETFYMNATTSGFLERAKLPLVCPTDQAAIDLALRLLAPVLADQALVVRIPDTAHLAHFWASSAVLKELYDVSTVSIAHQAQRLTFSADGALR